MVSDKIFELIKEKGMTQKEFSNRTGIPQGTISDWKRKKLNPSIDRISVICAVLEISADELLGVEPIVDYSIEIDSLGTVLLEAYKNIDEKNKIRLVEFAKSLSARPLSARTFRGNTRTDLADEIIANVGENEQIRFTQQKKLALRLRKLAKLDRIKLDESEHANGRNLHLLNYLDYVGCDRLGYIKQYLSNIQPFMISEFGQQESFDNAICVLDNYYRISVYIKIDAKKNEEIIVSFHENNKNGIAKKDSEKVHDEYIYVIPDSLGSKSGNNYTINMFITRGTKTFPINVPATRYDDEGFLVRFIYINNALVGICNDYLEDLYTADLDIQDIELFSSISQLSFTSYGNDSFSNISLLIDSILIQKDAIGKQTSDAALCIYCSNLKLDECGRRQLLETLRERYKVNSSRILPEILNRVEINIQE